MKRFEEIGIVERHEFRDGRAHYEKASKAHHDHLIDTATGRVIEFRSAEIERLQEEIAREAGFSAGRTPAGALRSSGNKGRGSNAALTTEGYRR